MLSANAAMVTAYWEVGRIILRRQEKEGWGARVIDRLSADLRQTFPDMQGLSARNLKYMRAFAAGHLPSNHFPVGRSGNDHPPQNQRPGGSL
jgi:predicted nuclease of restriction endonuclease-like (RecB) superfamily